MQKRINLILNIIIAILLLTIISITAYFVLDKIRAPQETVTRTVEDYKNIYSKQQW